MATNSSNMSSKTFGLHRPIIYIQILIFFSIFICGFLDLGGLPLLFLTLLFLISGVILLLRSKTNAHDHRRNKFLFLTAFSAILFSLGLAYGIYGIWGYCEIHDIIYIGIVAIGWLGFMIGAGMSLFRFK